MEITSEGGKLVLSYLAEVEEQTEIISQMEIGAQEASLPRVINGDLRLARKEIQESDVEEQEYLESRCHMAEARLYSLVADDLASSLGLKNDDAQSFYRKELNSLMAAFKGEPSQRGHIMIGTTLINLGRTSEAHHALTAASEGPDEELRLQAKRHLGRLGPQKISSPPVASSGANWTTVGIGTAILVLGLCLCSILIGIPLIIWGYTIIKRGLKGLSPW